MNDQKCERCDAELSRVYSVVVAEQETNYSGLLPTPKSEAIFVTLCDTCSRYLFRHVRRAVELYVEEKR